MSNAAQSRGVGELGRSNFLKARRLGIDTHHEAVVFMRQDCHVCRSEGFEAHARVSIANGSKSIIATLYKVAGQLLAPGEAGLSESAWKRLAMEDNDEITASHPRPLNSLSAVRGKVYGKRLSDADLSTIVADVVAGRYSDIHLSSFITACSARPMHVDEMVSLTRAMIDTGDRLKWNTAPIVDKHCVGGLPGNRTTPIIVAIATACGLTMPKTSSRAITSPAGTADTMETLAPVDLDIEAMRRVVEKEGGCIAWGGSVRLSPADDMLIRIERALDLDSEGQLVASVLSKKIAAGSTHVVIDIPVGPTAKVRDLEAANSLSRRLADVARHFGLHLNVMMTDGLQPVGRGIGPALEARDVIAVLQCQPDAPQDLRDRALSIAGRLLEIAEVTPAGNGKPIATKTLNSGSAWRKFQAICNAQGGLREPPVSTHLHPIVAGHAGVVGAIDNRQLSRTAKLSGAPEAKAAGIEVHVRLGDCVSAGDALYTIHAETPGELAYALEFATAGSDIVQVGRG
jgi:thymidine phosphorylase